MNRVIRHIEHLAITHDCVILPTIGAVLAHEVPARFDASSRRMLAPQRVFTFNPALSHNDGVLASSVARAEGLSYAQASQILDAELPTMRRALEEDSRLSLGRIGTLMRNADGSMRFVAAPAIEMTPSFMWLPTVDLAGFAEVEEVAAPAAAGARAGMRPRRVLGRVARMAAALSLFVAVGLALLHPRAIENPQQASLGVEMPKAQVAADIIEMPSEAKAPVILVLRNRQMPLLPSTLPPTPRAAPRSRLRLQPPSAIALWWLRWEVNLRPAVLLTATRT